MPEAVHHPAPFTAKFTDKIETDDRKNYTETLSIKNTTPPRQRKWSLSEMTNLPTISARSSSLVMLAIFTRCERTASARRRLGSAVAVAGGAGPGWAGSRPAAAGANRTAAPPAAAATCVLVSGDNTAKLSCMGRTHRTLRRRGPRPAGHGWKDAHWGMARCSVLIGETL